MKRSALITGATGFVGGHLVERLVGDGWSVRALVRTTSDVRQLEAHGVERVVAGLDDEDRIKEAADGVDVVFHLAATTVAEDEAAFRRANALGTRSVARGTRHAGGAPRLVYLSSYAACGPAGARPRTLADPPQPLTAYGRSKLEGELEVTASGVEAVVIRAPAVYGPGDRALLPYFRLVKHSLAPTPSGGERRLHLIFVEDLARALEHAADAAPGTYPVADPVEHEWSDVVGEIARAMGTRPLRIPLPPALVRLAGSAAERFGDILGGTGVFNREKAEEMLAPAWVCDVAGSAEFLLPGGETPLAEGVQRTARWYQDHGWI